MLSYCNNSANSNASQSSSAEKKGTKTQPYHSIWEDYGTPSDDPNELDPKDGPGTKLCGRMGVYSESKIASISTDGSTSIVEERKVREKSVFWHVPDTHERFAHSGEIEWNVTPWGSSGTYNNTNPGARQTTPIVAPQPAKTSDQLSKKCSNAAVQASCIFAPQSAQTTVQPSRHCSVAEVQTSPETGAEKFTQTDSDTGNEIPVVLGQKNYGATARVDGEVDAVLSVENCTKDEAPKGNVRASFNQKDLLIVGLLSVAILFMAGILGFMWMMIDNQQNMNLKINEIVGKLDLLKCPCTGETGQSDPFKCVDASTGGQELRSLKESQQNMSQKIKEIFTKLESLKVPSPVKTVENCVNASTGEHILHSLKAMTQKWDFSGQENNQCKECSKVPTQLADLMKGVDDLSRSLDTQKSALMNEVNALSSYFKTQQQLCQVQQVQSTPHHNNSHEAKDASKNQTKSSTIQRNESSQGTKDASKNQTKSSTIQRNESSQGTKDASKNQTKSSTIPEDIRNDCDMVNKKLSSNSQRMKARNRLEQACLKNKDHCCLDDNNGGK
jgi:hypothetical protein